MIKRALLACIGIVGFSTLLSAAPKQVQTREKIEGLPDFAGKSVVSEETTLQPIARYHRGAITALASLAGSRSFFSGGIDGFVTRHDPDSSDETWQVSDIAIRTMAIHPDGKLIAIHESDGVGIQRISVWNWQEKKRLYAKRFRDPVISLSWTAKGTYLLVGNSSIEGITVLECNSGDPRQIFKTAPGIVSLGITGAKETSIITFGPSGKILYTDMSSGATRASYNGPSDIMSPNLLNNNLKIAGFTGDTVYSIDATSGKIASSWKSSNPVMATYFTDAIPVWFEKHGKNGWALRSGDSMTPDIDLPSDTAITTALSLENAIIIGTEKGTLFSIDKISSTANAPVANELRNEDVRPIDDIASDGTRLYILSQGAVCISSGTGKAPVLAFDGIKGNRLAICGDKMVFWSSISTEPVVETELDGTSPTILYRPRENISSLTVWGTDIALIEGASKAVVLDSSGKKNPYTYSGAGLQDANCLGNSLIAVSKSATMREPHPLILIHTTTGETVPVPITGNLAYGFKHSGDTPNILTGFLVRQDTDSVTELITIVLNLESAGSSEVIVDASYGDEDLGAYATSDGNLILTNLGKGSMVEINSDNGKQKRLERGYALPVKAAMMDLFTVTLNTDATLTWFSKTGAETVTNTSITASGYWVEN